AEFLNPALLRRRRWNQRLELLFDRDRNDSRTVGCKSFLECFLDLFLRFGFYRRAALSLGQRDDVEERKIQRRHIGSLLQNRELLEDRVLPIAGDDVNHFELVLRCRCQSLNRILQRSISNQHDNRAASSKLLLSQRDANRRWRIVAQTSARVSEIRRLFDGRPPV